MIMSNLEWMYYIASTQPLQNKTKKNDTGKLTSIVVALYKIQNIFSRQ